MVHWNVYVLSNGVQERYSYFPTEESAVEEAKKLSVHFPGDVFVTRVETTTVWGN